MLILLAYLAVLVGLVVILGLIASKTLAMVRDGRPLVAVGALQWNGGAPKVQSRPQSPRAPDPVAPKRLAGIFARLRPAPRAAVDAVPAAPPRERSRRLASLSEFDAAEFANRFPKYELTVAEFAVGTEARIEAELDRLCAGMIDLSAFAAFVAAQQTELDGHYAGAPDPAALTALDAAGTVIAFSRDWVSQQQ